MVVVCGNSNERDKETNKTKTKKLFSLQKRGISIIFLYDSTKALSTRIRFSFISSLSYCHTYVFSEEFCHRKCIFSKTFSRVEILEKAVFSFTCGRTKTEVFQYDDGIHHVFLARRMLLKGYYCPSFVLAFSCGWAKTIRIR